MKQIAFMVLKPLLLKWLDERALRIPVADLPALEKRTKLSAEQIMMVSAVLRERAIGQIDNVLK
jgi:hypothetical protein